MSPIVSRRRDGMVQIRPRRLRNVVATSDNATLLLLFVAFTAFLFVVAIAIVKVPLLVALLGPCLGLGLVVARWARSPRLEPAHMTDPQPPPRRVA